MQQPQSVSAAASSNLPSWMITFAFVASLFLTLLKIYEYYIKYSKKPELNVRLTKEAFFRCALDTVSPIGNGEVLFANAVLLARNAAVLVQKVRFNLKKISGSKKDFSLCVLQFGEKVKGQGNIADHNFFTSSPLAFLPVDTPQRLVYLAVVEEYADRIRKKVDESTLKLQELENGL